MKSSPYPKYSHREEPPDQPEVPEGFNETAPVQKETIDPTAFDDVELPKDYLKDISKSKVFIAHDWCGWNEQYGRFTSVPSGQTLVCRSWMGQSDWDKAQLEFFKQFDNAVIVHRCNTGPYRETGETMGTVGEIIIRLESRLK